MGKDSGIAWTDHTFNPWIGCSKVNEGCRNCYAEREDKRRGWTPDGWGPGKPRHRTSEAYWNQPGRWVFDTITLGERQRVFCGSLMDVFDPEVPDEWRADLFDLVIEQTWHMEVENGHVGGLDWLLLTKRPENLERMLPDRWLLERKMPGNVWFGYSACDQKTLDEAAPVMESFAYFHAPKILFLSLEPMIGPVDLELWLDNDPTGWTDPETGDFERGTRGLDWVIVGAESGPSRKPLLNEWVQDVICQCREYEVPVFVKQLDLSPALLSHDPAEWPEDLRVREFPA